MKQRDVQDGAGITWTCVQAFSGAETPAAREAQKRMTNADEEVAVVCTPSGGEQTVRLSLPAAWREQMADDQLLAAIEAHRGDAEERRA
ncbi:hypothetical protein SAMN06265795_12510 [Noviherbaspirillum humi]|uniref:Uncharacterized protein n=1 Tax=Noviherbaspirillum humi TaxID=1688639 RepID=A0A239LP86_9BURK|nr:hypothetical protein [Noviherbaspirillum humi]SNT32261.1 hypothetical protein SAMN06265795_12510 [Noviherbaspirillum humi]